MLKICVLSDLGRFCHRLRLFDSLLTFFNYTFKLQKQGGFGDRGETTIVCESKKSPRLLAISCSCRKSCLQDILKQKHLNNTHLHDLLVLYLQVNFLIAKFGLNTQAFHLAPCIILVRSIISNHMSQIPYTHNKYKLLVLKVTV